MTLVLFTFIESPGHEVLPGDLGEVIWKEHPQEKIVPPELGDGYIFKTLTDCLWDWSLSILDYTYPLGFLNNRWKAPLLSSVFHCIGRIVPWCLWFGNEPIVSGSCHLGEMLRV